MKSLKYIVLISAVVGAMFYLSSCTKDLNVKPLDQNISTSAILFKNTATPYLEYLAKIYAGFSTGGIQGGDNQLDISGYDGGSQAGYLRPLWNLEELPTEEAMCCWNDATIQNFHNIAWDPTDVFLNGFYARLYYQITIATSFLQQTTDAQLQARGCSTSLVDSIHTMRSEARFLRALCYDNVLDLFRNGPLITDQSPIGSSTLPPYATGKEILDYITSELRSCQADLIPPTVGYDSKTYGHANQAAAWSLLARVYLNANTYLGTNNTAYYDSTLMYCNKVIAAGYQLEPVYQNLFTTDNYKSKEIIFPNIYDGTNLTTWGGLMFLECSMVDNNNQSVTKAPAAWGGNRAVPQFVEKFTNGENNYTLDSRYKMLYQDFNHPSIDDNALYEQGTPLLKFVNYDSQGNVNTASFATGSFPIFRLGDIYLMYAEAVLRGGQGGDLNTALGYINALRDRAEGNGKTDLEITSSQLTLPFILEERGRELFAEATRRTDLIRFGMFNSANYLWQWKGGVKNGTGFDSHWNIYPIPSTDMGANPNLKQNPGY
ncbi:MAG: RagB/SusD family nutrient uptake outer membrane protein [Bacteroidales bacterium]|nr:RagB/SusD family nutrient uptake outer membrane protein [Bacteroidales bacterium]